MFKTLYPTQLEIADVMEKVRGARIGVLGDFCIDAYWELDASIPETSIETGKQVQHVLLREVLSLAQKCAEEI